MKSVIVIILGLLLSLGVQPVCLAGGVMPGVPSFISPLIAHIDVKDCDNIVLGKAETIAAFKSGGMVSKKNVADLKFMTNARNGVKVLVTAKLEMPKGAAYSVDKIAITLSGGSGSQVKQFLGGPGNPVVIVDTNGPTNGEEYSIDVDFTGFNAIDLCDGDYVLSLDFSVVSK